MKGRGNSVLHWCEEMTYKQTPAMDARFGIYYVGRRPLEKKHTYSRCSTRGLEHLSVDGVRPKPFDAEKVARYKKAEEGGRAIVGGRRWSNHRTQATLSNNLNPLGSPLYPFLTTHMGIAIRC